MTDEALSSHSHVLAEHGDADHPTGVRGGERWEMPLLERRPGGLAAWFAARLPRRHPVIVFLLAALAGLIAMWAASIALGYVVVELLLNDSWVRGADEYLPEWLAANRRSALTDISQVGSAVGGGFVLPVVVGLLGLLFAVMRKWRAAAYPIFGLMLESATYRATSIVHPRERPEVPRLEGLPADASYPSGHTAAAIAVYAGFVLLITSRYTSTRLRAVLWTLAITLATFVAMSRMYRGMHHPLDVLAGVPIGIAAIIVLVFCCRAAHHADAARSAAAHTAPSPAIERKTR